MKQLVLFIFLITSLYMSVKAVAQNENTILTDSIFSKYNEANLASVNKWEYKGIHNSETSVPNQTTNGFKPIDITLPKGKTPNNWNGLGWFRTTLIIDSTLYGKKMAIRGMAKGAFELYVNNELVGAVGKVGTNKKTEKTGGFFKPIEFNFSNQPEQLIYIKYSNHTAQIFLNKKESGLHLYLGFPEKVKIAEEIVLNRRYNQENRFYLIFGFMAALSLLHLFLFFYYPTEKANLTCALFFLSISGIFLSGIIFDSWNSTNEYIQYILGEGLSITINAIIVPFFIYQIVNRKFDWLPFLFLTVGIFILVMVFINPVAHQFYYYSFFLLSITFGIVFLLYVRFKHKLKALNIILLFYIISVVLLLPSLLEISIGLKILWYNNTMLMNLSAIPASVGYSLFLARGVALTNKRLKEQLKRNEQLSNEKLKSETDKKQILENQKKNLEAEVTKQTADLRKSLQDLKSAQAQLIQQEKLASLGELTAGIAHEIKNPLNFVNNFSEVSKEMIQEVREEIKTVIAYRDKPIPNGALDEMSTILDDIESNLEKIHHHGTRADGIVQSMLQHSRGGSGKMEATDLNALIKEYTNLAFHGMRAKKNPINVEIDLQLDPNIETVSLISEDFSRVILNLTNNAFDAMRETADQRPAKLTVRTKQQTNAIVIEVEDNGPGIPDDIKDKILQPFFTTKKGTEGTGLGLSITNDIVKAHGGNITISSNTGKTIFTINLKK